MDKLIIVVTLTLAFGFIAFPTMLYMLLVTNTQYTLFIAIILAVIYGGMILKICGFLQSAKRIKMAVAIGMIVLVTGAVPAVMQFYKDSLPTVGSEVSIYEYLPFQANNKLVTLGEPATLTLEEPLPILDGATAMFPLYAAVMQTIYPERLDYFEQQVIQMNTTPEAYKNVLENTVDVIFVGPPSKQQQNMAETYGKKLELTPIGKEAFVFFVHKNNPVDSLTIDQIQKIYSGDITNWSQVGGENEAIRAFQRPQDSGSQTALQNLMGDIPIMEAPRENVTSGMGGMINEVAQYRNYGNAIGYSFRYYTTDMIGNHDIKLLAIEGVEPTKENIRNGRYPIADDFYAITAGTTNPQVELLLQWMTSQQGQKLVEKVGYVSVFE